MKRTKLSQLAGLATLLVLSSAAHANWDANFLVGIDGGYAWRDGTASVNISSSANPSVLTARNTQIDDSGFVGGILAGYQIMCNEFLLGLEANLSWQNIGEQHNFSFTDVPGNAYNASAKITRGTVFGLTMRAGYQVTDWMLPYIRLGAETSNDEIQFNAVSPTNSSVNINDSRRGVRFVGGAGLEFPLYLQSVIRLEYDYSSGGRGVAGTSVTTNSTLASPTTFTASAAPTQNLVKVQLVWNFE